MSTVANLERQYDEVIQYISSYRAYVKQVNMRVLQMPVRHPFRYFEMLSEAPSAWKQTDLLSGRNAEFSKTVWAGTASDAQKRSDYYPIMMSDYPLHALSESLVARFPGVDFAKLKKLQELKKSGLSRFNAKQTLGIVFAIATVLLKSVPESVVARVIDYKQFELLTFIIASLALLYLFLVLLPFWLKTSQANATHVYANEVLEYTCIRLGKEVLHVDGSSS